MIWGSKFERFGGGKMGKLGEMLDPLETKKIHGSNPIKPHQTNKSQKKIGAIFGGEFSNFRTKSSQRRLENGGRDTKYMINLAHDTI